MREMEKKQTPKKTASQRQRDFVQRKLDSGYIVLSSLYVPKVIADECRKLVKDHVAAWEAENKTSF